MDKKKERKILVYEGKAKRLIINGTEIISLVIRNICIINFFIGKQFFLLCFNLMSSNIQNSSNKFGIN
jgi:hypothetical protein